MIISAIIWIIVTLILAIVAIIESIIWAIILVIGAMVVTVIIGVVELVRYPFRKFINGCRKKKKKNEEPFHYK